MQELIENPETVMTFLQYFKLGLSFGEAYLNKKWKPNKRDEKAAWAMYVEMSTRVITQPLLKCHL